MELKMSDGNSLFDCLLHVPQGVAVGSIAPSVPELIQPKVADVLYVLPMSEWVSFSFSGFSLFPNNLELR